LAAKRNSPFASIETPQTNAVSSIKITTTDSRFTTRTIIETYLEKIQLI
jgi:hypothetical protein